jgi:hypothetical protein
LFHKVYSNYAAAISTNRLLLSFSESDEDAAERMIRTLRPENIDAHEFNPDLEKEYEFKIGAIQRNSPLELILYGIPVALTAAVILSGGKVKITGIEFELPPIGKGVKHLRQALGREPGKQEKVDYDES